MAKILTNAGRCSRNLLEMSRFQSGTNHFVLLCAALHFSSARDFCELALGLL